MSKLRLVWALLQNMGFRYVAYRVWYELQRRTGLYRRRFPTRTSRRRYATLEVWREQRPSFFFESRETLGIPKEDTRPLQSAIDRLKQGQFLFFNAEWKDLGPTPDWMLHPITGYRYAGDKHWTQIPDFSADAGDIKYVWERARFSHIHAIVRWDYHSGEDCAEWVLGEIEHWIRHNPVNCGPHYRCSQEISLRVLNWTWALYYYAHSPSLTHERFAEILDSIYWQLRHVRANIQFSRIAVRNNHAITETQALYLGGCLFPFFPEAKSWKASGKKWAETEIAYQIYPDGAYLQFSHNYHRVVIQLLSWAIRLSEIWGEPLSPVVRQRAEKSLEFLIAHQDQATGWLPNYGANDGALFFPLSACAYRDYRPQLNTLHAILHHSHLYPVGPWREEAHWMGLASDLPEKAAERPALAAYPQGGFYVMRKPGAAVFIRCGRHINRPAQADNLHLDLWVDGLNLLRDAGSYRYNTQPEWMAYFNGTRSHNTVGLGKYDQMLKGPRFIWLHWSQALDAHLHEDEEATYFEGSIQAFAHLEKGIVHRRRVKQYKNLNRWEVTDRVVHHTGLPMNQYWHLHPDFEKLGFSIRTEEGISAIREQAWHSPLYGIKEASEMWRFTVEAHQLTTIIEQL